MNQWNHLQASPSSSNVNQSNGVSTETRQNQKHSSWWSVTVSTVEVGCNIKEAGFRKETKSNKGESNETRSQSKVECSIHENGIN